MSISAVGWDGLRLQVGTDNLVVLHVSDVPVSLAVEVDVSHVRSEHLGHQRPVFPDLADKVILRPALALVRGVDLIPGVDTVLVISELDLASDEVDQRAEDRVKELVLVGPVDDLGAVARELYDFATLHLQVDGV